MNSEWKKTHTKRTKQSLLFFALSRSTELGTRFYFHLSQLRCVHWRACGSVFVFSPNLFIHRSECFRLIRECSFFKLPVFFLRFVRRFKAYTHELTVIDFIVVALPFFSASLQHRLVFVAFAFRWFTLIYSCSRKTIFFLHFCAYVIQFNFKALTHYECFECHLFIHWLKKKASEAIFPLSPVQNLINYYAIFTVFKRCLCSILIIAGRQTSKRKKSTAIGKYGHKRWVKYRIVEPMMPIIINLMRSASQKIVRAQRSPSARLSHCLTLPMQIMRLIFIDSLCKLSGANGESMHNEVQQM